MKTSRIRLLLLALLEAEFLFGDPQHANPNREPGIIPEPHFELVAPKTLSEAENMGIISKGSIISLEDYSRSLKRSGQHFFNVGDGPSVPGATSVGPMLHINQPVASEGRFQDYIDPSKLLDALKTIPKKDEIIIHGNCLDVET